MGIVVLVTQFVKSVESCKTVVDGVAIDQERSVSAPCGRVESTPGIALQETVGVGGITGADAGVNLKKFV